MSLDPRRRYDHQFCLDTALVVTLAAIGWVVGWWGIASVEGADGWRTVPELVEIPDGAIPRDHLVEMQCGGYGATCAPAYQPRIQQIPTRYIPGPPGPIGPHGRDGTVDYEQAVTVLLGRISADPRFRGPAGQTGPPGPRVTEIDYDRLAVSLRVLLADDISILLAEQRQALVIDVSAQVVAELSNDVHFGSAGPIDDATIDAIAARVRARIAGEIRYEVVPER